MPKKDSLVWKYYTSSISGTTRYATCKFCNKQYVTHADRMRKHLSNCTKSPSNVNQLFVKKSTIQKNRHIQKLLQQIHLMRMKKIIIIVTKLSARKESSAAAVACVEDVLEKSDSLYIQTDGWTDITGTSLLNIIFTTPKPIFYKAIDSKDTAHTGQYICDILTNAIEEVGPNKVRGLVSDNAGNMKLAWSLLKEKYGHIVTYGCAAHGLNLLAKDILLQKQKKYHNFFRNKHVPKQILKQIQLSNKGKELSLSIPIETRWNSVAQCLKPVLKNKDCLQMTVLDPRISGIIGNLRTYILDEKRFWPSLVNILSILEPIAIGIQAVEGDKSCLAEVYPVLNKIESAINQTKNLFNSEDCRTICNSFAKRRQFILYDLHLAAYLLHPKYQGKYLKESEMCNAFGFIANVGLSMNLDQTKLALDLAEYKAKQNIFGSEVLWAAGKVTEDPATWWSGLFGTRQLSIVASRVLNFPATSCSSERNWKTFSLTKTKKRNRLSTETMTKLVYVKFNLKLFMDELQSKEINKLQKKRNNGDKIILEEAEHDADDVDGSNTETEDYDTDDLVEDESDAEDVSDSQGNSDDKENVEQDLSDTESRTEADSNTNTALSFEDNYSENENQTDASVQKMLLLSPSPVEVLNDPSGSGNFRIVINKNRHLGQFTCILNVQKPGANQKPQILFIGKLELSSGAYV
ncbi:hypothetical protein NQ315_017548 [Exocentrus adspersus]|uniref:BED-type domain-containing protein n=1 Tax=Exocentrus adspersus TaxID=1586481 RepID=A0AAV8V4U0_9CUCU|nr:hypothetical protein NQ315_017548 [Exocentrus adspersus]